MYKYEEEYIVAIKDCTALLSSAFSFSYLYGIVECVDNPNCGYCVERRNGIL